MEKINLKVLFNLHKLAISFTWFLVVAEAGLLLLFPLFMGMAINDYLDGSFRGLYYLAGIAVLELLIGAGRRFYDTRLYSKIYATLSPHLIENGYKKGRSLSQISARANLATEFVEYLENYFPAIIESVIALVGSLILILALNTQIFWLAIASLFLIALIYGLTSNKTYRLNSHYNAEIERQVDVIKQRKSAEIVDHFNNIKKWNIRLSDLETANFSISWILLMGILLFSIIAAVSGGETKHGDVLALLMYVFNFIESVVAIPYFYQQFVRLREISDRLNDSAEEAELPVVG